ncbi:MAG: 4-hydroxybenzoate 3-monooxygenase [Acidimicrobiales bacterium]|jgi:p-hydroxybenzoate 3-monooxygenase
MRTNVVIIGAGPAGALLSQILHNAEIDHVILERQTRDYVLTRIRAGVLEWSSVEVIRAAGVGDRMDADGAAHDLINLAWGGEHVLPVQMKALTGRQMMAYGQTELQHDLYEAADNNGTSLLFSTEDVAVHDVTSDSPYVTFRHNGVDERIDCDYIAGCDGFHGVSRAAIPESERTEFERIYPFGWLGILSETPPLPHLVYTNHERGFGLCSTRNPMLSRYYVQCPIEDTVDDWSDDRFWSELAARLPTHIANDIVTGPSIEKSIAPLRSFVAEPMRHGNLFLAGDSAHIVPPTGAKGLNLAVSDVHLLSRALIARYANGDTAGLDQYSSDALHRVWGSVRFSWWMTTLMHRFPGASDFEQRMQERELEYLASSTAAQTSLAEQYVGLPFV